MKEEFATLELFCCTGLLEQVLTLTQSRKPTTKQNSTKQKHKILNNPKPEMTAKEL